MNELSARTHDPAGMGWEQGASRGSEIAQLKVWCALPLRARLEALDQMNELARRSLEQRRKRGLPYIDPYTRQLVQP